MTQLSTPIARPGSQPDVYSAMLAAAVLMLLVGIIFVALRNVNQTAEQGQAGSPFKYLER